MAQIYSAARQLWQWLPVRLEPVFVALSPGVWFKPLNAYSVLTAFSSR